ncbi:MAG: hypothetical protein HRT44_09110, partial [Bdellovibrionales bacterium]|nr:hypothetical protein [Bdellovibrionales bacterium]NQZ19399.1 hypothetical protein [Bdellovibrionales bacterium]
MEETIQKQRKTASDLSLGLSHKVIYKKALSLIKKTARPGGFLDFGAGQGKFVSYVHDQCDMNSYSAVDLMERPEGLPSEIQWIQSDLNDRVEVADESYQMISA